MSLFCTVCEIYSQIFVENRRFNLPHLYLAPPLGWPRLNFAADLWQQKTRMTALSCDNKNIAGRFFGLVTKHACDGRTDGRTDRITTPKTALSIARTVKTRQGPRSQICHASIHWYCLFGKKQCFVVTTCVHLWIQAKLMYSKMLTIRIMQSCLIMLGLPNMDRQLCTKLCTHITA